MKGLVALNVSVSTVPAEVVLKIVQLSVGDPEQPPATVAEPWNTL